jgi:sugar/nucleoside kinase (ribokinase family)
MMVVDSYPIEDHKYIAQGLLTQYGGMATNIAVNLSRLGLRVALIAAVGQDEVGKNALEHLAHFGVDISGMRIVHGDTQKTLIVVNRSNATRTAIAYLAPQMPSLDSAQQDLLAEARLIYCDGSIIHAIWKNMAANAKERSCPTFYNLEFLSRTGLESFQDCTYGIMSGDVAKQISTKRSPPSTLKTLWRKSNRLKGITLGTKGSWFYDGSRFLRGLVYKTEPVDTTGAGDAFQSGLILGILREFDLRLTLNIGSVMAGLSCTVLGGHNYPYRLDEILRIARMLREA